MSTKQTCWRDDESSGRAARECVTMKGDEGDVATLLLPNINRAWLA